MIPNSCGLVAGFALAANAFMIPSIIALPRDKLDAFKALDVSKVPGAEGAPHYVKLDCPGCSFDGPENADKDTENSMVSLLPKLKLTHHLLT